MIFCLSFGLSMDYELFLLARIQPEFLVDGDNDRATVAGLSAVAPVITGAGLIMAVVFGAFVVPAFMRIAGRWNWYSGRRHPPKRTRRSPNEDSEPSDISRS